MELNVLLEDINYHVEVETLKSHKFVEYFSAKANFGYIKAGIQPPKDAKEIFMGGGIIGSDVVEMGVFGTIEELFDQREYPHHKETEAKRVRKYYSYYSSGRCQPIGFSKTPAINLCDGDAADPDNQTKLSAYTTYTRNTLWRCGSSNMSNNKTDFKNTFQIVFYYRT